MMNARKGVRRLRLMLTAAAALVIAAPSATQPGDPRVDASVPARDPETRDRIKDERLEALVAGPAALIEEGRIEAAERAFERLLARQRAGTAAVSDHLTAFGLAMFMSGDEQAREGSVAYFRRAVAAARAAFGPDHPELALSLNTYADAQTAIWPEDPPREADAALAEAYRIRLAALGPRNIETLANLIALAEVAGLPSRTGGDRARIEAAAAQFRDAVRTADNRRGPAYYYDYNDFAILLQLSRMYARNGLLEEALAAAREASAALRGAAANEQGDPCFAFVGRTSRLIDELREDGRGAFADTLEEQFEPDVALCVPERLDDQSAIATVLSSVYASTP